MKSKILNKLKYFLFEFIIVTLGILTAFSINKWDENRKQETEEYLAYQSLKNDLESELYVYNYYKQPFIKSKNYISPILERNFEDVDSLMVYLNSSFDLQERNATYINLKFSGNLEILKNNEIKNRVTLYYETYYQALENMSSWNYDFRLHFLQPYLIKNLKYSSEEDLLEHLKKDQFLNIVNSQYQLMEYNISSIEKAENLINKTIEEIDRELNKDK
ncbi:DUF6090 family protein [Bizionia paragorgiae]|uniref:Uncharacterized protein n=1 Tax=Bizionia paragorgiae TaxID=283786 RepID=A0A1H4CJC3_BIZPA|nr:DUF6090 family protein [Bizionia paragorgiae]SEA60536.1 hypothetical protein SAMN04487990_12026 [Bizionia paragorgiae]